MKHIQLNEWSPMNRLRLTAAGLGVIAVAAAVGIAAADASATAYPMYGAKLTAALHYGTLEVRGTKASEKISLRLKTGQPSVIEVDAGDNGSADFSFARADVKRIVVDGRAGNDAIRIDEANGAFENGIPTILAGAAGKDTLAGGSGAERLLGGSGADSIDGNGGADTAFMGAGNDTFIWDPGDGSDKVEGQQGADTMVFNGAAAAEQVDVSANGNRLRFFRNPGNITMDTAGVERVDFNALGGADSITVHDLKATDVRQVNLDLAAALGGVAGDRQADRITVTGTEGSDNVDVSGDAGTVKIGGLAATVRVLHPDAALDDVNIDTLGGTDSVSSAGLAAGAIQLFVDGNLVR
jgi:Ca2+-binding RTX toxin-like protein